MYQFSGKIKLFSIILVVVGILGIGWGFATAPSTIEEAKEIMAKKAAHGDHGHNDHGDAAHHDDHAKKDAHHDDHASAEHKDDASHDSIHKNENEHHADDHKKEGDHAVAHGEHHGADQGDHHAEHVFHQLQNRPWASFYVALIFFLGITLLVLAFYAAQRVAQSGWSIVLFRVMEAITANLVPTSIIMLIMIILTGMHYNHLFVWMGEGVMDKTSPNFDPIVYGKKLWLNTPGWMIRSIIYLLGWNVYRWWIRRNSILEDQGSIKVFKRNYNVSVIFLVFFMLTESMASWDWIMGLDPHWFSTLFGWYVLASLLVSALTVIAFVTIYLRSKGYLPKVNDSHIHDLAKFMFGFSVFWTYLWFAQFMLIWYANIPEETYWYDTRFVDNGWRTLSIVLLAGHLFIPFFLLMGRTLRRNKTVLSVSAVFILVTHWVDHYWLVMPQMDRAALELSGRRGDELSPVFTFTGTGIIIDIACVVGMIGLFLAVFFLIVRDRPLVPLKDPRLGEALNHEVH